MKTRVVSVTEFKAKCLALLDDVGKNGGTITITKRGQPLATVKPATQKPWTSPEGMWAGLVEVDDEALMKDRSDSWAVLKEKLEDII